ncbi:TPA: hypothetical protein ACGIK9_002868 [Acinetobacter baumannii]|uniref:hypothetical protein n=1 Tax=Acinetobacter baumannii TaxID=470 RepID=UPI00338E2448
MREILAKDFINLIIKNEPNPIAVAQIESPSRRTILHLTTRINAFIKFTYRKGFTIMADGTVFFDVKPFKENAWVMDSDIVVTHENKVLFDNNSTKDASKLFEIVSLNVLPEVLEKYISIHNEVKVAQTLMPYLY